MMDLSPAGVLRAIAQAIPRDCHDHITGLRLLQDVIEPFETAFRSAE